MVWQEGTVADEIEIEFSHREKILEARRMRASLMSRSSRSIRINESSDAFDEPDVSKLIMMLSTGITETRSMKNHVLR